MTDKKLLSKRVNFPSIHKIIDDHLPQFQQHFKLDEKQTEEMKAAMTRLFSDLLFDVGHAANLGAQKGIDEALEMMKNPEYYETLKKRDVSARQRDKEWREQMKREEEERQYRKENPTYEDKQNTIFESINYMVRSKEAYQKNRDRISKICENDGNQILVETIKDRFKLPDIWLESFDIDEFIQGLRTKKVSEKPKDFTDNFFDKADILDDGE